MATPPPSSIIPAQLGFLAIYNPSLGTTDDTLEDQIVYYASAATLSSPKRRRHRSTKDGGRGVADPDISREELNERLRQIGLAQGMVEFAKTFSGGKPVDSIDTERSRVVLHELEPGWWILASIDLTRLPLPPAKAPAGSSPSSQGSKSSSSPPTQHLQHLPAEPQYEYSTRDVKPPLLLLQDLLRAHALFLLHHAPSLSALFASPTPNATSSGATTTTEPTPRPSPREMLARYWDAFLSTWHVLLHGNPAVSALGGIKMAASGELGMGVGEEERGSGEREVLEGLVWDGGNGLVDLVVGKYGSASPALGGDGRERDGDGGWLGLGNEVGAEDGVVFSGVGTLSRRSLRNVVGWMEEVYAWGEGAYGVVDAMGRGKRKRRGKGTKGGDVLSAKGGGFGAGAKSQATPDEADVRKNRGGKNKDQGDQPGAASSEEALSKSAGSAGMDTMLSYLTLGYGTYWSLGGSASDASKDEQTPKSTDTAQEDPSVPKPVKNTNTGRFLLGLANDTTSETQPDTPTQTNPSNPRTVIVELQPPDSSHDNIDAASHPTAKPTPTPLHPVIYVHKPFIYVLLFHSTPSLPPWPELSQSLHIQLSTLHKPLLSSTAYRPEKPSTGGGGSSSSQSDTKSASDIYDLVFDTRSLTIHSTIPNIPEPALLPPDPISIGVGVGGVGGSKHLQQQQQQGTAAAAAPWTRAEALSTHAQILSTLASARADRTAVERTCKTSRGWWVVWSRVSSSSSSSSSETDSVVDGGAGGGSSTDEQNPDGDTNAVDNGDGGGGGNGSVRDQETAAAGGKEIFLVRRASDQESGGVVGSMRGVSASYWEEKSP
ncbi:hypothetical protein VTJ49DRAFT_1625 [Mycothermus thermophilus]|uniref:CCZ1/INTU/HSP4 first Longin domain-containing protein n=1 Tax=Humicola insolens TaxID=85995 RepID=A0ABR3VCA1_HUMIN